jgi:ATP-dependent Clp protease ATP-binding subunit ClpB
MLLLIQETFDGMTDMNRDELVAEAKVKVYELLKKTIRPEFLNRIDEVIMFSPLSREEIKDIVVLQFKSIQRMLEENGIKISATEEALDWLSELGYDPQFGARPLKRVMQKRIMNELSKKILAGTVTKDDEILVKLNNDKQFEFENIGK